jgi:polysaccharide biosynthesis transport protein
MINQRITGRMYSSATQGEKPWYRSRRLIIFGTVFLISAMIGLAYNYSRTAIYRSSATLLTSAMTPIDRESNDADIQHVAIQRQILLGHELLVATLSRLKTSASDKSALSLTPADLQSLLTVDPVEDTNLVEIKAEGPDPKLLPLLINTWIDVYLDARSDEVKRRTGTTTRILEDELKSLTAKINAARLDLESFRKAYDISSTERDENEALARLKGLTDSLNKASEEEVKARATLNAIRTAISRGQAVVPEDEKGSLLELEKRLQDLREKLAELDKKFTREYLNLQPELRSIPEQIKELEAAVNTKRQYGKNVMLTDAEMSYAAAQQTVREIRAQLDQHKKQASAFTSKFIQHDALKTDLEGLEKLYRDTQERLVQVKASNREKYPQVSVISRAYEARDPIRPDYSRDALLVLAGSLLLGLFGVWISEYLTQKKEQQPPVAIFGIQKYAEPPAAGLIDHSPGTLGNPGHKAIETKTGHALASPVERELSSHQLRVLLDSANLKGKQLIGLLLSGLAIDEIISLTPDEIDVEAGTITVPGRAPRTVPMGTMLKSFFRQSGGQPAWDTDDARSSIDLSAALVCAAVDSGLPEPDHITADGIRHGYIAYLVRQGLRLSDLEQIVGYLDPDVLASYRAYSPPQQGRHLYDVELLHPALMSGLMSGSGELPVKGQTGHV